MDGEVDFLKIYTANGIESDSAEILLSHQELKNLANALMQFENEVEQFKIENKDKENLGFTHLHLKDCGSLGEHSKVDIVFYVDLSQK
jgi:hypothetical protein